MPYLRLTRSVGGGLLNMIEMRAVLNIEGLKPNVVRDDIERVWSLDVSKGLRATHCFKETANGIVCYFAALTRDNNYVTGVLYVSRKQ